MNRHPSVLLTTNIVGGLGNQLFLLANLYATTLRVSDALAPQQLGAAAHVQKIHESSSCHAPRPTYWDTPLMKNVNKVLLDSKDAAQFIQQQPAGAAAMTTIPERGPAAAPFTLSDLLGGGVNPQQQQTHANFVGFFQSDRYFSDLRHQVVDTLLPNELLEEGKRRLKTMCYSTDATTNLHTVALHVRRGDYLLLKDTFEVLSYEYYCKALETLYGSLLLRSFQSSSVNSSNTSNHNSSLHFGSRTGNAPMFRLLIFSEDKAFAKTLCGSLNVKYPTVMASCVDEEMCKNNSSSDNDQEWNSLPQDAKELILMSACDDVVAANSSFSWWAGYFAGTHSPLSRVVAPQRWFVGKELPELTHVYPADWIVV